MSAAPPRSGGTRRWVPVARPAAEDPAGSDGPCGTALPCGVHRCLRPRHAGPCGPCAATVRRTCYCGGRTLDARPCTADLEFSCSGPCPTVADCGHPCSGQCHTGPCPPCPLSPERVTHCPCGAKALYLLTPVRRQRCTDPIPVCGGVCGRPLPCASRHKCPAACHPGPCPPCAKSRIVHCRCGATCQKVACGVEDSSAVAERECERKCAAFRSCGRHKCERKCCPATGKRGPAASQAPEHACPLTCDRVLSCGNHRCELGCHPGPCPPCSAPMTERVACACGRTSVGPPLPCGTPLPPCPHLCRRPRPCGHPTADHRCHPADCPPCPASGPRPCVGAHVTVPDVPCGAPAPSCGAPCGGPLPCGAHKCTRPCHSPPCPLTPRCLHPCGRPLPCQHPCARPCHGVTPCPRTCQAEVAVTCPCGALTKSIPCQRHRDLAARLRKRGLSSGDPSAVLDCDGECARLYRLRGLAEALNIAGEQPRSQAQRQVFEHRPREVQKEEADPVAPLLPPMASSAVRDEAEGRARRREQQDAAFLRLMELMLQHRRGMAYEHRPGIHKELSADKANTVCGRMRVTIGEDSAKGSAMQVALQGLELAVGGQTVLRGAALRLQPGARYALIGRNGVGKTLLLDRIAKCAIHGFPTHIRTWHVKQDVATGPLPALEAVLAVDEERTALLREEEELLARESPPAERLSMIAQRLEDIGAHTAVARATAILKALRFTAEAMRTPGDQLSGGWRMRLALAQALFYAPDLLMLDEPTNHLDLRAVLWLQRYLRFLPHMLVVVSHDRAFLNEITTHTIHFEDQALKYYPGRFDQFLAWREEKLARQRNQYGAQERRRERLQTTIGGLQTKCVRDPTFDTGMLGSRKKKLAGLGMEKHEDGKRWKWSLDGDRVPVAAPTEDPSLRFGFPSLGGRIEDPPAVDLQRVSFSYGSDGPTVVNDVTVLFTARSRIGIVGINGSGKSTLLRMICGQLVPTAGNIFHHRSPRIGYFAQHHVDTLPLPASALDHLGALYPGISALELRTHLGAVGIHGDLALQPIGTLSGGQRARVAFSAVLWLKPHLLLLDEPTNHMDYDTMDALGRAVESYEGGIVVVSHDEHFITAHCEELFLLQEGRLSSLASLAVYKQQLEDSLVENADF